MSLKTLDNSPDGDKNFVIFVVQPISYITEKHFKFWESSRKISRIFRRFSVLIVVYNKLFTYRVFFSYCKILRPRSFRTDLASSVRTTKPYS